MKQNATQQFISECGRAKIYVENDMPIGVFHDFLMHMKGIMVERMVDAHKEELKFAESQKQEAASDDMKSGCCA